MKTEQQATFNEFVTTQLNPEQQKVVQEKDGVLLVCAGAGSGKTRVITARITNLILTHDVPVWSIIALTFTNKAAKEMQERVRSFLPHGMTMPFVGTFHSYCLRLLKTNSHLISIPEFSILDSDDQEKLVKQIMHRFGVNKKIAPKQILHTISELKNSIMTTQGVTAQPTGDLLTQQIVQAYEKEKAAAHCYDFDDLLVETIKLFHNHPEFKAKYQNTVRHILVDEYQDTNHTQHTLLKVLSLNAERAFTLDSLCVVGDEDQSIYSWRGATVTNIINFNKDYPEAQPITIQQNYRSVQPILDAANSIIQHNTLRNKKKLWSMRQGHDRIRVFYCNSGYQEADAAALLLRPLIQKTGAASCAILYRSHYQSRVLEEALIRYSIPYKIVGGIQFYERLEVKDLLAYLRVFANNFDRISFMRAINTPHRGLGDSFQEQFLEEWDKQPFLSFKEVAKLLCTNNALPPKKQETVLSFLSLFDQSLDERPATLLETFITRTKYFAYLKDAFDTEEAQTKTENVKELINAIRSLEEQGIITITDFLHEVALLQDAIKKPATEQQCVTLMTLHAAKGLEFDTILLTGLEEGILPSTHSLYQAEKIEEERRLLYVGITRARERLVLMYTRYRTTFGQMTDQSPSRFMKELTSSSFSFFDCSQWATADFIQCFQRWLATPDKSVASVNFDNDPFDEPFTSVAPSSQRLSTERSAASRNTPTTKSPAPVFRAASTKESPVTMTAAKKTTWYKHQPVNHEKFGVGIVDTIEIKNNETTYLTVKFKTGSKKIDSRFVEKL